MNIQELMERYLDDSFLLKQEFLSNSADRENLLNRCEKYAGWTLPRVFPNESFNGTDELQNDYQSVGAQAVNNLSNKIMMSLFQPSKPFFKLQIENDQVVELKQNGISEAVQQEALAEIERDAMKDLAKLGARVALVEILLQLIITGNSLLYASMKDEMQVYSLRDYVLKLDLRGSLVKLIIRETKSVSGLSDELARLAKDEGYSETDEVGIYTCAIRVDDKFFVWQELEDICYCHKKPGVYEKDKLPWIPLTWTLARGQDYGTGLVEEYAGDFHTLSTLAEATTDFTTVATDVKTLVNPTGMTDVREISRARSGDYVQGREEDLATYSADVTDVTAFLESRSSAVERRIAAAFLMNSNVTRDAERVTAEEIRMQALELEHSVGGVYSRLARDLQLPLAKRLVAKQDSSLKDIEPVIITGLDSLSRSSELDNFRAFLGDLVILNEVPEDVRERLKIGDVISFIATGHGVDHSKLLKDEDTVQKEKKARLDQEAEAAGITAAAKNQQG